MAAAFVSFSTHLTATVQRFSGVHIGSIASTSGFRAGNLGYDPTGQLELWLSQCDRKSRFFAAQHGRAENDSGIAGYARQKY
jgi:hypothetical protein